MQEFGKYGGVRKVNLAVERIDSSNMKGFRGQQTSHKIDISGAITSWRCVDGKLCDDFVCSMVSAAMWNTNLIKLTEHFDRQPLNRRLAGTVRFLDLYLRGLLTPWELQVPTRQLRDPSPRGCITFAPRLASRSNRLPFGTPTAPAAAVTGAGAGKTAAIMHRVWRCRHRGVIDGLEKGLCNA